MNDYEPASLGEETPGSEQEAPRRKKGALDRIDFGMDVFADTDRGCLMFGLRAIIFFLLLPVKIGLWALGAMLDND